MSGRTPISGLSDLPRVHSILIAVKFTVDCCACTFPESSCTLIHRSIAVPKEGYTDILRRSVVIDEAEACRNRSSQCLASIRFERPLRAAGLYHAFIQEFKRQE